MYFEGKFEMMGNLNNKMEAYLKTRKVLTAIMFSVISASVYSEENLSNFNEIGLVFSNLNS